MVTFVDFFFDLVREWGIIKRGEDKCHLKRTWWHRGWKAMGDDNACTLHPNPNFRDPKEPTCVNARRFPLKQTMDARVWGKGGSVLAVGLRSTVGDRHVHEWIAELRINSFREMGRPKNDWRWGWVPPFSLFYLFIYFSSFFSYFGALND